MCCVGYRGLLDVKSLHLRDKKRTKEERDLHNLFKCAAVQPTRALLVVQSPRRGGPHGSGSSVLIALESEIQLNCHF